MTITDKAKLIRESDPEFENKIKETRQNPTEYYSGDELPEVNYTEFTEQPVKLFCGAYVCNDNGIVYNSNGKKVFNFPDSVIISKILKEHLTGLEQVEIAFKKRGSSKWIYKVIDRSLIADTGIIRLSQFGLGVTKNNASELINYLHFIISYNYSIPTQTTIMRFGYVDGLGFSPYSDKVKFSGEDDFGQLYASVIKEKGDSKEWKNQITNLCRNTVANIVITASFSSILLEFIPNFDSFYIHIFGNTGTGKSTLQRIAASVWGNPVGFMGSYNSTQSGLENFLSALYSFPFIVEDTQHLGDENGRQNFNIYSLTGKGKIRSNKKLTLQATKEWHNIIISSGEFPLLNPNSPSGALNRIIEIELTPQNQPVSETNLSFINRFFMNSFGHAGKYFVSQIYGENKDFFKKEIEEIHQKYHLELLSYGVIDKLAMDAAFILTGSQLLQKIFFDKNRYKPLTAEDIMPFLKTKDDIDIVKHAYQKLLNFVSQNYNKFIINNYAEGYEKILDIYGFIDKNTEPQTDYIYIQSTVFEEYCRKQGYNSHVIKLGFKERGLSRCETGRNDIRKRIPNTNLNSRCICIKCQNY
jgi:uncharacterized protein (DUF927 family)